MPRRQKLELPRGLVDAVREQRAILFLGSGASLGATGTAGQRMPKTQELANALSERFLSSKFQNKELMRVSELASSQAGKGAVNEWLRDYLGQFEPTDAHTKLPSFRWRLIATTNYDLLVERAYDRSKARTQTLVKRVKDDEPIDLMLQQHAAPLEFLKLHGCIDHIHDPQVPLVLTPTSYNNHQVHRRWLYARLEELSAVYSVIFCGHSISDLHIRRLIEDGDRSVRPFHYLVTPELEHEEVMLWAERRVDAVRATFADFMEALNAALPPLLRLPRSDHAADTKPYKRHFKVVQDESDRLSHAFRDDLQLVHSDIPLVPVTADAFYSGYDQGWGSIRRSFDVHRRASHQLLEFIAEGGEPGPRLAVLRGAAGYGKSIALRRAAWELGTSLGELVIWIEDGARVWPDVLQELYDLTGKTSHIFIDRAAFNIDKVESTLAAARAKNIPITVVTAERTNEWSIYCQKLDRYTPSFFEIGRLSEREIDELIEKLEQHNCLGALIDETPARRREIVTGKLDRQLLVILHEITKGLPFETIIADEFRRISPPAAQELYLDVCTLNQFDVPVRAGVISRISGIGFREFEAAFFSPLEELISTDRNIISGDYEYRSRHALVSEIVFAQICQTDDARRDQLIRVIHALDRSFQSDSQALSGILRGRTLAETFENVDLAREIYDVAAARNPEVTFIGQQRAIFEITHRRGNEQKAQEAIDAALALDPANTSLKTTRAQVLRHRSQSANSEFARETLRSQARAELNSVPHQTDAYVLGLRARLRVDAVADAAENVKRSPTDARHAELAEAVEQAERALTTAYNARPTDPDLLQTEASLKRVLGEIERSTELLLRAWNEMPRGSGLAKRLAKRYMEDGNREQALSVLSDATRREPTDRSLRLAIASIMFQYSRDIRDPIATDHLRASFVNGDREHLGRFISAAHSFALREYELAYRLFSDLDRRAPTYFQATLTGSEEWLTAAVRGFTGKIVQSFGSYMFISSPGIPKDIYAPSTASKEDIWDSLKVNSAVTFDLDFNRKGPFGRMVRPSA